MKQKNSKSPKNKTASETFNVEWRGVPFQINWTEQWLNTGMAHLELRFDASTGERLPVSATGYRSYFINPVEVIDDGGPVAYVTGWLDAVAASSAEWQAWYAESRQLTLF